MISPSAKKVLLLQILFSVIAFLLLPFYLGAQPKSINKITTGLNELYNFEFRAAEKSFQQFINLNPDHPAGYYFKSIQSLWFYLDNKKEEYLEEFFAWTDTAVEKAETLVEQDTTDVFSSYVLGSVYYQRAVAFTRNEDYLSALWAIKMFSRYFNRTLQIDSSYYDAYMYLGLYNFAVSQAPQSWRWALDLTGIEGDREAGFNYLKLAAKKGKFTRVDAEFYLSQLQAEFFLNFRESEKHLKSLNSRYPGNLLFRYALGNLLIKKFEQKAALKFFQSVLRSEDSIFTQIKNYSALALGDIFYTQNNFDSALTFYRTFLRYSTDNHLKGITALKTGFCYLFKGDSVQAINYFKKTDEGNPDLDEDVFAKIRGEQFLENLPDSARLALIRFKNILDSGRFRTAIDSLENLNNLLLSDTIRAELMLYISDAYFHLGRYKLSLEYAIAIMNFEQCETWVKAFACYYAARASNAMKNFEDAELFIEYASNYTDFFFGNKLADRFNALSYELHK